MESKSKKDPKGLNKIEGEKEEKSEKTDFTEIRHSFEAKRRSRSQPNVKKESETKLNDESLSSQQSNTKPNKILNVGTDSETHLKVQLHPSKSENDILQNSSKSINHDIESVQDAAGDGSYGSISLHQLYKEALYTAVHMLGKPSRHFPTTKQNLCLYVHEAFCSSHSEQKAVIDHVIGEPYPLTIVNSTILRADGLVSSRDTINPYCMISMETEDSLTQTDWLKFSASPVKRKRNLKKEQLRPIAEERANQIYEKIPPNVKTSVHRHSKHPVWEQRFQCLSLRPTVDIFTVEIWDYNDDELLLKALNSSDTREEVTLEESFKHVYETTDRKKGDVFLGKVTYKVSEIPVEGVESGFELSKKHHSTYESGTLGSLKLQLWLVHALRHGKHYHEVADPRKVLASLWDRVLSKEREFSPQDNWDGSLTKEATSLLFQYALQNGISEETHAIIRWNAYCRQNLDLNAIDNRLEELGTAVSKSRKHGKRFLNSKHIGQETFIGNGKKDLDEAQCSSGAAQDKRRNNNFLTSIGKRGSHRTTNGSLFQESDRRSSFKDAKRSSSAFAASANELEISMVEVVKGQVCPIFRRHLEEPNEAVHKAIKAYSNCYDVLKEVDPNCVGIRRINWLATVSLALSALEWYEHTYYRLVETRKSSDSGATIRSIVEVLQQVNNAVKDGKEKWHNIFLNTAGIDYINVIYPEFQKMVIHDVESHCWTVLSSFDDNEMLKSIILRNLEEDHKLSQSFLNLYAQTQNFIKHHRQGIETPEQSKHHEFLQEYDRWFRPILMVWLGFVVSKGSSIISKSIHIDNVIKEDQFVLFSSSAIDTVNVFYQLVDFWEKLKWPDPPESYTIIQFLVEVMSYYTVYYAQLKHQKLESERYFDDKAPFEVSDQLCTSLNNIEHVLENLTKMPQYIHFPVLIEKLSEFCGPGPAFLCRDTMVHTINNTVKSVEMHLWKILKDVSNKLRPEVHSRVLKYYQQLYELDSSRLDDSTVPILDYIDPNIITLKNFMKENGFLRALYMIWELLCEEIAVSTVAFSKNMNSNDEQIVFFERVLQMFPLWEDYFKGGEAGLTDEELKSKVYEDTVYFITYFTQSTEDLIKEFYAINAQNQNSPDKDIGALEVDLFHDKDTLNIHIIKATKLVGDEQVSSIWDLCRKTQYSSDPFVSVKLRPMELFGKDDKFKTSTKWKTTNPIYNEKYSWGISKSQCQQGAVIVFTVRDYDYVSRNDFLGEASVPLSVIPGVSGNPVEQPMTLSLRTDENSQCNPILVVLKSRKWDLKAQRFYECQSARRLTTE